MRPLAVQVLAFALAGAVGWAANLAGLPLGWLLGAAVATGVLAASGVRLYSASREKDLALAVIGTSVGLGLTPAVAASLAQWAPLMVGATVLSMVIAILASLILSRLGRVSRSTAYFSVLPAGLAELAFIGQKAGADGAVIATLHAVRVGLVVIAAPAAVFSLTEGDASMISAAAPSPVEIWAGAIALGLAAGYGASWLGLPAGWFLGAIIGVGALACLDLLNGRLPEEILVAAQLIVGYALGVRFKRDSLAKIPRALAVATPLLLVSMALMAALGLAAGGQIPESAATLILAFSIGGTAEMVLTAKSFGENAALVAAFQVTRGFLVNLVSGPLWRLLSRCALFRDPPSVPVTPPEVGSRSSKHP